MLHVVQMHWWSVVHHCEPALRACWGGGVSTNIYAAQKAFTTAVCSAAEDQPGGCCTAQQPQINKTHVLLRDSTCLTSALQTLRTASQTAQLSVILMVSLLWDHGSAACRCWGEFRD